MISQDSCSHSPLTALTLFGPILEEDQWLSVLRILDFASLIRLQFGNSNFGRLQWMHLVGCLPADGKLPNGRPIPLKNLIVSSLPFDTGDMMNDVTLRSILKNRAPLLLLPLTPAS